MKHYKYKGKILDEDKLFEKLKLEKEIIEVPTTLYVYMNKSDGYLGDKYNHKRELIKELKISMGLDIEEVKGD